MLRRLGGGQRRRHHDGARMQDGDPMVVVELQRMRERAVGQRGIPCRRDAPSAITVASGLPADARIVRSIGALDGDTVPASVTASVSSA